MGRVPSGFLSGRGNSTKRSGGVWGNAAATLACWAAMMAASRSWIGSRQANFATLGMSWTSTGDRRACPSAPTWSS